MRLGAAASLAVFFGVQVAGAQELDPAAAEALFAAGRRAMAVENYEEACAKFAESNRLDPAAGTLINLAECYDKQGKLASAWQKWREARQLLRERDDRVWAVESRIKKIEERLPRLAVVLEPSTPENATAYRDEVRLGPASFGHPMPIDPGSHTIRVEAPGHESRTYSFSMVEGEAVSITVGAGAALPPEPPKDAPAPVVSPAPSQLAPPGPDAPESVPWLGYVVGGTGVAVLATGAVFGALALGKKQKMDDECVERQDELLCSPSGLRAADSGRTFATFANVGVVVGLVGVGAGAYLILSNDSSDETSISAHSIPGGGNVAFSRKF